MKAINECTAVQLIRNATIKVSLGGTTFLIDPMLGEKGSIPGFPETMNMSQRNPLVDLPLPIEEILKCDAVILTHTHDDHWDERAKRAVPKDHLIFVNNDAELAQVKDAGFTNVRLLRNGEVFKGVTLYRANGNHGTDEMLQSHMGAFLGHPMGVIFEREGFETVYVVGDTVWIPEVSERIKTYRPGVIVLNAGNAMQPAWSGSIIMGGPDFIRAYREAPDAAVVAVHLDAVNHCVLHRPELRMMTQRLGMDPRRALIPADGEVLVF
jgi:L-ascorbate metabolism protein UlaG (beta-lactamase superfamily)